MYQTVVSALTIKGEAPIISLAVSLSSFLLIFIASFAIGLVSGFIGSYIIKKFHWIIKTEKPEALNKTEVSIMVITPVLSYLIPQGIGLSGIVSILFCGYILSQYAAENLSLQTRKVLKLMYQASAYICESTVFMFLGMSAVEFYVSYEYFVYDSYIEKLELY